jgi:RNA polymerase sporulation-specific sigma factor
MPRTLATHSDVDLAALAQGGDRAAQEALIERYRRFARARSRSYFLVGADADDVEQEALIGLYKAVRDFRPEHQASFRAFAELCISRQVITAIKTATRQKHQALNQAVSFSLSTGDDGDDRSVEDVVLVDEGADPAEQLLAAEQLASLRGAVDDLLSDLEVEVLQLYVEGRSYVEMSERLGRQAKSIDNAIQRIKRKLDGHVRAEQAAVLV